MVRPRVSDFVYSELEMEVMAEDIAQFKSEGVQGVVVGVLTREGFIDVEKTRKLVAKALPMEVTFHRAIDMTCYSESVAALEDIAKIEGITRVLTSGFDKTVTAVNSRLELLAREVAISKPGFGIMPGSGVNSETIAGVLRRCHVREVHLSGGGWIDSVVERRARKDGMGMGYGGEVGDWVIWRTDGRNVASVRKIVDEF